MSIRKYVNLYKFNSFRKDLLLVVVVVYIVTIKMGYAKHLHHAGLSRVIIYVVMMTCLYIRLTSVADIILLVGHPGDRRRKSCGRLFSTRWKLFALSATNVD